MSNTSRVAQTGGPPLPRARRREAGGGGPRQDPLLTPLTLSLKGRGSSDCFVNRLLQSSQPCHHVGAKVDTERAAVALAQAEEVAERLRRLEHAERVGLAGDRQIFRIVGRDLEEHPRVRPALVQLSRRVEEAGSLPKRPRRLLLVGSPQTRGRPR